MDDGLHLTDSAPLAEHDHRAPFRVRVRASTERTAVLALRGEVDLATVPELRKALSVSVKVGVRHLILDCADLAFLDATGLGALVAAANDLAARGGMLVVRNPSSPVFIAISASGLAHLLEDGRPASALSKHAAG